MPDSFLAKYSNPIVLILIAVIFVVIFGIVLGMTVNGIRELQSPENETENG